MSKSNQAIARKRTQHRPVATMHTTTLLGWRQDEDGHWVAVLACGHTQHLRHQPPWQSRAWVLDAGQRLKKIGQPFACGWCAKGIDDDSLDRS